MPDWSPLPNPVEVGGEEWRLAVAAELRDMRMSLEAFGEGLGRLEVRVDALASEIETHTTYHDTDDGAVMPPSGTTIGPLVHSNETRHTPSAFEPEVYDSRLGYATTTLTDGERQVEEIRARLEDLQASHRLHVGTTASREVVQKAVGDLAHVASGDFDRAAFLSFDGALARDHAAEVARRLVAAGVEFHSLQPEQKDLESVFRHVSAGGTVDV